MKIPYAGKERPTTRNVKEDIERMLNDGDSFTDISISLNMPSTKIRQLVQEFGIIVPKRTRKYVHMGTL